MPNDTTNSTSEASSQTADEFPGYPGYKIGDLVPNMGGVRIGDVFYGLDEYGREAPYNWNKGDFEFQAAPNQGGGTPPTTTKREDGAIVTSGGIGLGAFPGRPLVRIPGSTVRSNPIVDLALPPIVPEQPNVPILPQAPSDPKYTKRAPIEPPTVPIPARRADVLESPYMGYVNYDPDEILAAAMRVINGRMAGRSMLNDLRR